MCSLAEKKFFFLLFNSQAKKYVQGDEIWIGAVKYRDVTWNWTDNSNFDFTNWKTGDEKEDHDDCGVLQINYGYWLKDSCLNEKPFVCQTSSFETSSPPANPCKDKKWIYFEPTNSCYSISFVLNYNQSAAEDFCKTQGSHLVSLHSHEEAIFILDIESVLDYATWLGLKSDDQGVTWKWFDGTPTDYMPWLNGSPPNSPTQKTCVILIENENGEPFMTGDYCGGEQPFICKKPVPTSMNKNMFF
uniref:C-type lectin domain-containing protein n=1 Tax=Panagrolaimus davidi TaxID=227884 RepID=A0A914QJJ1_9BILA